MVQGDRAQAGGAGGEGFEAALGGADSQDGSDDEGVGRQDEHSGGDDAGGQEEVQHILLCLFHITSQFHERWNITEEVINNITTTKTQCECVAGEYYCIDKTPSVGIYNQTDTESPRHDLSIEQGTGNGRVAVISHGSQQVALTVGQPCREEELDHTASEGDAFVFRDAGHQDLWGVHRGVPEIQEREIPNEKIHGCVQSRVTTDQPDEGGISYQGHGVDTKEHHEQDPLHLGVCCESHKDELSHRMIVLLHGLKRAHLQMKESRV